MENGITMLKSILKNMANKIRDIYREKPMRYYEIDGFMLDMGEGHMLSLTQKACPMYDRFVPFFGELADRKIERMPLTDKAWIIDIGANVGDTVAGFVRHTRADIICVEPTQKFITLLRKNIKQMGAPYTTRIHPVRAYIAQNSMENYKSNVINGTAIKQKVNDSTEKEAPTYTLLDLLQQKDILSESLVLIKVDTDGYDSECIMSLGEGLKSIDPILFWENQIDMDEQMHKFVALLDYLSESGYADFFVFDNFGNYLCHVDVNEMKNINHYLGRILHHHSPRSFYYVDVLACKKRDKNMCQEVVEEYVKMFDVK